MFLILVYDVNEKRVNKVLKTCRKYLHWVQNSVLEGEISEANLKKLKIELSRIIDKDEDSVIFYILRTTKYSEREILGLRKGGEDIII
ncbi:CRISPR-associated protein, Cas2 family [Thermoanaerobacter thermohydrosulfuricus]|jgi:CRISPR-associated protein Cas2|uniref:CRISPR-associated endoribonuclease Cas2 n=7 Tax=Thermoanaerobacter TaxID=1754 RepID=B0KBC9_THEP3|nr:MULTISPECIES: CRISPR-associated endonuclease Cas2 [Thermoanaerobacter]EGD50850.1 CRISPR-associated protein Cas2 [Thermoanaerobacter ethanolicus JW 200]KUJ89966.1 MAG: CRISPR-associated protein Cas2 [Thermoanaerobacter thermocopriae]ABY93577.1 CRISPR-associated protein Cas2 [Thermoanaerobacter sp. X514]ABY93808.1 CRISPR-associated protein Cas2 [Thermoanaerobacter pseudethanolicus ATCC 33223]ADV78770.1 CRISPR-associated protein Cas2 [Thermoanaerobacter brockii subsp. finnii Ako-1]